MKYRVRLIPEFFNRAEVCRELLQIEFEVREFEPPVVFASNELGAAKIDTRDPTVLGQLAVKAHSPRPADWLE